MDVKALIARQRAIIEAPKTDGLNVALGGELVPVEVARLMPDDWQLLVAAHPPRKSSRTDANIGYDQHGLCRSYPADRITVAGEPIDAETWADLWDSLNSVNKNNVHTLIWGLNVYDAIKELQELGKAAAGSPSSSPGNRASRRAGSKGGSPQK